MRAVWSFWTKPFKAHRHATWLHPRHHLLSWILSFETIRKYYPSTTLFTDDEGARLLVDQLELAFDTVSTDLNALANHDPGWWTLGKVYTYRAQREPFIHFDSDMYLWKPLCDELLSSPVLAQNPEPEVFYRPELLESGLSEGETIWLPAEWVWYRAAGPRKGGDCCGIFGGHRVDFISHFAGQAIKLIEHPDNRAGWARLDKIGQTTLVEQYLLAACIEYHRVQTSSPFHGIQIGYVFNSMREAFDPDRAAQIGFTHLLAESKRDAKIAERIEQRVKRDYPDQYQRCMSLP